MYVASNAERWNALLALARIENCWSLQLLTHSLLWRRCSPIAESHCGDRCIDLFFAISF